ncbi:MAG: hypothetical protein M3R24_40250 [Chloroflexota bacterium]|nr:hypothetical protein [Chloroflexota bacterium]
MGNSAPRIASFLDTLKQHPEATAELPVNTYWRYVNAIFPGMVVWLMCYPALLRALADDAERNADFWRSEADRRFGARRHIPIDTDMQAAA